MATVCADPTAKQRSKRIAERGGSSCGHREGIEIGSKGVRARVSGHQGLALKDTGARVIAKRSVVGDTGTPACGGGFLLLFCPPILQLKPGEQIDDLCL